MVEDDSANSLLNANRKSGAFKLQIVPVQPKTLSHLPTRPAVDLAFHNLTYSVREGRRGRKLLFLLFQHSFKHITIRKALKNTTE